MTAKEGIVFPIVFVQYGFLNTVALGILYYSAVGGVKGSSRHEWLLLLRGNV